MICKNCESPIIVTDNYCSACGAKHIRNRLTLRNLLADFGAQYLNLDNRFLRTFLNLFSKPEDVIVGYINGTRKKYVNVISYFTIAITLAGLQLFIQRKFFPDFWDFSTYYGSDVQAQIQQNTTKNMVDVMLEYQSLVMILYLPVFAMISKMVFFNLKKFNYTEHIVIFAYAFAQYSIVSSLLLFPLVEFAQVPITFFSFILSAFQFLYTAYCLKRVFGLSLLGIFLRTLFFLGILVVLIILSMLIFFLYLTWDKEALKQMIEAQKQTQEMGQIIVHYSTNRNYS